MAYVFAVVTTYPRTPYFFFNLQQVKKLQGLASLEATMEHSTMANLDIMRNLVQFIDAKQYLFFASVSRTWNKAWGRRPAITSYATSDTSVSQLVHNFKCGLPRTDQICAAIARMGDMTFYSAPSYTAIPGLGWRANRPLSRAICTFLSGPRKNTWCGTSTFAKGQRRVII